MSPEHRYARTRRRVTMVTVGAVAATVTAGAVAAATLLPGEESAAPAEFVVPSETTTIEEPVIEEVMEPEPFDYGECPPAARACVDLDGERAWLQRDGEITHDAVPVGQGGPGYETPRDSFHVTRKVKDEVSYIYDMAPMPYSVYFTNVGHAFHEGDPDGDSHGCVRLPPGDAEVYFNELQVGDLVHIY